MNKSMIFTDLQNRTKHILDTAPKLKNKQKKRNLKN